MEHPLESGQGIPKLSEISFNFNTSLCLHRQELPEKEAQAAGLRKAKMNGKGVEGLN